MYCTYTQRPAKKNKHCLRIPEIFLSPHLFLLKHHSRCICKKIWTIEALCKAALVFIGWAYTFNSLLGGWLIPMAGEKNAPDRLDVLGGVIHKENFLGCNPRFGKQSLVSDERDQSIAWGLDNCIRGVVFHLPPNAAACIRLVDSTFQKAWMHQGRQGDGAVWEQKLAMYSRNSQTPNCAYITNLSSHYTADWSNLTKIKKV